MTVAWVIFGAMFAASALVVICGALGARNNRRHGR